jgi:hypothetical protein
MGKQLLQLFANDPPFVDGSWTGRQAVAEVTTGPHGNSVSATVELFVEDESRVPSSSAVSITWEMRRRREFETIVEHPLPHPTWSLGLDEVEAFAAALSEAVRVAKERGLLAARGRQS